MSKERARTYADFRVGDVFTRARGDTFVLLSSVSKEYWDVLSLCSDKGHEPPDGPYRELWHHKTDLVPHGYTVYRGSEVICTT